MRGEPMQNIIVLKPDFNTQCARSSSKTLLSLALGAGLLLWALAQPTAAYAALGESKRLDRTRSCGIEKLPEHGIDERVRRA